MVKRMHKNIDQMAANVALGYPPIEFCLAATTIETMHCMRPKNCDRHLHNFIVRGGNDINNIWKAEACLPVKIYCEYIGFLMTYRHHKPHMLQGKLSLILVLIKLLYSEYYDSI